MENQNKFFYLFTGAAMAIVIGTSMYHIILSLSTNFITPLIIKLLHKMGVDTTGLKHSEIDYTSLVGDIIMFIIVVVSAYFIIKYSQVVV